jgi:hypothetical protein
MPPFAGCLSLSSEKLTGLNAGSETYPVINRQVTEDGRSSPVGRQWCKQGAKESKDLDPTTYPIVVLCDKRRPETRR